MREQLLKRGGEPLIIAGPCSVENRAQLEEVVAALRQERRVDLNHGNLDDKQHNHALSTFVLKVQEFCGGECLLAMDGDDKQQRILSLHPVDNQRKLQFYQLNLQ